MYEVVLIISACIWLRQVVEEDVREIHARNILDSARERRVRCHFQSRKDNVEDL